MSIFTAEERSIIRSHRFDTVCYVLAQSGACLDLARERVRAVTGRKLQYLTAENLPAELPRSWMLAVVLCPGDDTHRLGAWAAKLGPARHARIIFYEPDELDATADQAYAGWNRHPLPDPIRRRVRDFKEFNRFLGTDLNIRILDDHQPARRPPT